MDGTITTDGTEQTIWDITADKHFAGWIFMHNMASGDSITVKIFGKDQNSAVMRVYKAPTFTGVQTSEPAYYIPYLTTKQHKVTIQRTAGTDRAYTWQRIEVD